MGARVYKMSGCDIWAVAACFVTTAHFVTFVTKVTKCVKFDALPALLSLWHILSLHGGKTCQKVHSCTFCHSFTSNTITLSSNNFLLILICLETTCFNEINETSIKHMSVKKLYKKRSHVTYKQTLDQHWGGKQFWPLRYKIINS